MSLIQVQDLHTGYGAKKVLKGINFIIENPTFMGIIGANGCGKTTLLKSISGYLNPWKGSVTIAQTNIQRISIRERARMIGYVPQNIPYDFAFSSYDLVMMGRIPYLKRFQGETTLDREVVREAMELTHTWDLKDQSASELSGGERQRVYIARALAQKPTILLLDEPIAHLDIKYQVDILSLLQDLCSKGILVLAALHDINLASQYCNEIIMMKDGVILARGKARDVLVHANIDCAFSIKVEILDNPLTHTPYIVPLAKKKSRLRVV